MVEQGRCEGWRGRQRGFPVGPKSVVPVSRKGCLGETDPGGILVRGAVDGGSAIPSCYLECTATLLEKAPGYRRPGHPCPEPVPSLHSGANLFRGMGFLNKYKSQPLFKLS